MSPRFLNSILSRPDGDVAEAAPQEPITQEEPLMSDTSLFVDVQQGEGPNALLVAFNAGGITRDRLHELLERIEAEVEAVDPQGQLDIGIVEALRTRELRVTIEGRDAGNALIDLGLVLRRLREAGFATRWPTGLDLTRLH